MNGRIVCVDASIAAKLVLPEDDSDVAASLWLKWRREETLVIAPSLITWEVANSIRKTILRGKLPMEVAAEMFSVFMGLEIALSVYDTLPAAAWRDFVIGLDLCVSPYDAPYLVPARNADCALWTADERLLRTVGDALPWVRALAEMAQDAP